MCNSSALPGPSRSDADRVGALLDAIADYSLWAPGRAGHAAARRRLLAAAKEIAKETGHFEGPRRSA